MCTIPLPGIAMSTFLCERLLTRLCLTQWSAMWTRKLPSSRVRRLSTKSHGKRRTFRRFLSSSSPSPSQRTHDRILSSPSHQILQRGARRQRITVCTCSFFSTADRFRFVVELKTEFLSALFSPTGTLLSITDLVSGTTVAAKSSVLFYSSAANHENAWYVIMSRRRALHCWSQL